ncbi:acyltransferase family protein [Rhodococcoides kyotonense]|uniref:Peptidoglycan/LPS O-acetylase OafA/YrhL, contains acyltransferase and SGNH-hydrolase domains n=1 Tax=Rhodococcoides kyotonense TaxID=398843 RepID=A0A239KVY3_9NOCA|nr:acyltransferase family protein [Rhodococcus kyotonensis]SNT21773.1 Peptidoglycan/LPS O-acetylase OafA/YrhL, contains acyltransferase and SGNH-hydrolase domains [Rhodococcus kyotonensis]
MHAQSQPVGVTDPRPSTSAEAGRAAVREDLNGLRGVAIALVVVFHVWMGRVSGGVDVFLVLTGFFFTASLIRTAQSGGSLNPFTRVGRVLRRLGPPLVLVLAGVAVATLVVFPRTRWAEVGDQLVSGVFFFANWELAWTSQDYLAADPTVSPLQHLWSVAVQFQFYLLAIAVVFGLAAIMRRSRGGHRTSPDPRVYLVLFGGVALLSFVYAADGATRLQSWNYYDTGARLWEILAGAALAAVFAFRAPAHSYGLPSRVSRTILAVAGLGAIVACGFVLDGVREFPGPWALLPVLATLALIVAGPYTVVAKALRSRTGLWLGSIAFPLYLWHWPILIFWLSISGEPSASLPAGAAVIAVSVVLAMATVKLVEKPMQAKTRTVPRLVITGTAAAMAAVVVAGSIGWNYYIGSTVAKLQAADGSDVATHPGALALTDGAIAEDADVIPSLFSAPEDLPVTTIEGCIADFETRDAVSCEYGDVDAPRTIALAGSSHAEHWITALDLLGREHGFRVVTYLKMGCPLTLGTMPMLGDTEYPDCLDWSETVLDRLEQSQPDYVFTTSTRPRDDGPGDYTPDWYLQVWAELSSYGIPVLAMRDNPWLEHGGVQYRAIDCLADGGSATSCGMPRENALSPIDPALAASFRFPRVLPLDMSDALCDDDVCRVIAGNVLIYRDEHHLTTTYMRTLTTELGRQMASATGWW